MNDYNNVIFNIIKRSDREEIFMSVDFQSYFDPYLPSYNEIEFNPFVDEVEIFIKNKYLPWLNSNYVEV